jgi:hypothetical protein
MRAGTSFHRVAGRQLRIYKNVMEGEKQNSNRPDEGEGDFKLQ